jgi:hypothetical protein
MLRLVCATASWATVLAGVKGDGWARQARAEAGRGGGTMKFLGGVLIAFLIGAGAVFGWLHATPGFQRASLTSGWYILAAVTVVQVLGMLWRIVRRQKARP